jgi:hypothetical protein
MIKVHTRARRRLGIYHKTTNVFKALRKGVRVRPKTFSTKEGAKVWAEKNKIKNFTIKPAKTNRFQVVVT